MKSIFKILYLILPVFIFMACDDEPIDFSLRDDVPEPATDSLVGSWELVGVTLQNATASYEIAGNPFTTEILGESSTYEMNISFSEDNSTSFTGSYLQTLTLQLGLSNPSETFLVDAGDLFTSGSWSRTRRVLEITNEEQSQEIEILNLSNNSLQLLFTRNEQQLIENLAVNLDAEYVLTFERTR